MTESASRVRPEQVCVQGGTGVSIMSNGNVLGLEEPPPPKLARHLKLIINQFGGTQAQCPLPTSEFPTPAQTCRGPSPLCRTQVDTKNTYQIPPHAASTDGQAADSQHESCIKKYHQFYAVPSFYPTVTWELSTMCLILLRRPAFSSSRRRRECLGLLSHRQVWPLLWCMFPRPRRPRPMFGD